MALGMVLAGRAASVPAAGCSRPRRRRSSEFCRAAEQDGRAVPLGQVGISGAELGLSIHAVSFCSSL
eukprot:523412-Hanusia_phi.AAC.1